MYEPHMLHALLRQADGLFQLEMTRQRGDGGDLWYAAGGRTVFSTSRDARPNTNSYQGVLGDVACLLLCACVVDLAALFC